MMQRSKHSLGPSSWNGALHALRLCLSCCYVIPRSAPFAQTHPLVETQDVFGDVVNVAARVEACALPDQILISSATYERLPLSVPCRFLGATQVQGKATPIELYEVSWDERRTFRRPCCCAVP